MPQVTALRIGQHHQCRWRHRDARVAARSAIRSAAAVLPIDRDADGIVGGRSGLCTIPVSALSCWIAVPGDRTAGEEGRMRCGECDVFEMPHRRRDRSPSRSDDAASRDLPSLACSDGTGPQDASCSRADMRQPGAHVDQRGRRQGACHASRVLTARRRWRSTSTRPRSASSNQDRSALCSTNSRHTDRRAAGTHRRWRW